MVDSTQIGIPFAQVLLCKSDSSLSILQHVQANANGKYSIKTDLKGKFFIKIIALGYNNKSQKIVIDDKTSYIIDIKPIILTEKPIIITDVQITRSKPIAFKKDTIIYSADAFVKGDEEIAEDVLKRLPGVDVSEDGTVSFKGKEVENIMIENDDLFGKGYQLITKNLHASSIDKVEVYNRYSNNELLKDIEESDKVALNLKLTEKSKFKPFGNITLGYTTDKHHDAKLSAMSLGKKTKFYLFGNSNEQGYSPMSDIQQFTQTYNETSDGGIKQRFFLGISRPNLNRAYVRFNKSHMASANAIFNLNKNIKIKFTSFIMREDDSYNRQSNYTYLLPDTTFTNTEDYSIHRQDLSGFLNLEAKIKLGSKNIFVYTGNAGKYRDYGNSNLMFNADSTIETQHSYRTHTIHSLQFTHKFDTTNVLDAKLGFLYYERPEDYRVNRVPLLLSLNNPSISGIQQNIESKYRNIVLSVNLLNKIKSNLLLSSTLNGEMPDIKYSSTQNVFNKNWEAIPYDSLSNGTYRLQKALFSLGENITIKLRKNINLSALINGNILRINNGETLSKSSDSLHLYLEPGVNFEFLFGENSIKLGGAYNITSATITEIYDKPVIDDYRSSVLGLGRAQLLRGYTAIAQYTHGSWFTTSFLNLLVLYNNNPRYVSTESQIEQNVTVNKYNIHEHKQILVANLTSDHTIRAIRNNIKFKLNGTASTFSQFVNGTTLPVKLISGSVGLELRSIFRGFFDYHIGCSLSMSEVNGSRSHNNMEFLDLYFDFCKNLSLTAKSERYYFSEISGGNNPIYFVDLNLHYKAIPNRLTINIDAVNLLNNKKYHTFSETSTMRSDQNYGLRGRYFGISVGVRF